MSLEYEENVGQTLWSRVLPTLSSSCRHDDRQKKVKVLFKPAMYEALDRE